MNLLMKYFFYLPREVDVVLKYLEEQRGAKRIGVVGFCWGGVATHYIALQYPEVKAGVSVYGNSLEKKINKKMIVIHFDKGCTQFPQYKVLKCLLAFYFILHWN